jgi:hypothetical protein
VGGDGDALRCALGGTDQGLCLVEHPGLVGVTLVCCKR